MSFRIDVRADVAQAIAGLKDLERDLVPKALVRALNKTADNVKVQTSRLVREKRPLPAAVVKDAIRVTRANRTHLTASVTATGKPIPLREYNARQLKGGVKVTVTKGNRAFVGPAGRRAFTVDRIGGHVFQRVGKGRLPIKKLFGPSIPGTLLEEKTAEAWQHGAEQAFEKRLDEELAYEVRKFNARR